MIGIANNDIADIAIDDSWNYGDEVELLMHKIHVYPAKFPAFIATKAFDYAEEEGVNVESVADIFCGCGTVALEAKAHGKDFWGCDINPVATLIAKAKSKTYESKTMQDYFLVIKETYQKIEICKDCYNKANARLQYWYCENSYLDLWKLQKAIESSVSQDVYLDAFKCVFSSILKATSKWLTKSIKPQVDPHKKEIPVWDIFKKHYDRFLQAIKEIEGLEFAETKIRIETENFLNAKDTPKVDLIISSPPYVTSYEYADLHQLSTLWLEYVDDYRDLRQGTIGSVYNSAGYDIDTENLNSVGNKIVEELIAKEGDTSKVRSVARYYKDIQTAIEKCKNMVNAGGMVFFVVGDTEYKSVKIKNSNHLIQSLEDQGFSDIKVAKRRISNKLLTPYRDSMGRFSSDKSSRKVYHEEYVISGRMK